MRSIRYKLREDRGEVEDEDLGTQETIEALREDLRKLENVLAEPLEEDEKHLAASKQLLMLKRTTDLHKFCEGWRNKPPAGIEMPSMLTVSDENVGKWILYQYMNRGLLSRAANWNALNQQIPGLKDDIFAIIYKEETTAEERSRGVKLVRILKRWLCFRNKLHGSRLRREAEERRRNRTNGRATRGRRTTQPAVEQPIPAGELQWILTGRRSSEDGAEAVPEEESSTDSETE